MRLYPGIHRSQGHCEKSRRNCLGGRCCHSFRSFTTSGHSKEDLSRGSFFFYKKNRFLFAPLQSKIGETIIKKYNIDTTKVDSILLYSEGKEIKIKSSAALHIAKNLGFPQNFLSIFFIIPTPVRTWVYNYIANNRYKWYGKKDACMIPTPELKAKFLD